MRGYALSTGALIALVTFAIAWWLFGHDTDMWGNSFFAALLTSGLVWVAYIIFSWLFIAIWRQKR